MSLLDSLRAYFDIHPGSRKIFVVGTGRSGTHWLGHILDAHSRIETTFEHPGLFDRVVALAIDPEGRRNEWKPLLRAYRRHHADVAPNHYVDKSHPALWLVPELREAFPRSRFLAIDRNPYAVVNSMLQHEGVRRWCEDGHWEATPRPNRFLGVDTANEGWYRGLTVAQRCAHRWLVHHAEAERLAAAYPAAFLLVRYEDLFDDLDGQVARLTDFLDITLDFDPPAPNAVSAERWRRELSDDDVAGIAAIVGFGPP